MSDAAGTEPKGPWNRRSSPRLVSRETLEQRQSEDGTGGGRENEGERPEWTEEKGRDERREAATGRKGRNEGTERADRREKARGR